MNNIENLIINLDKRSRSVNKTRESNIGIGFKGKGSIERYSGLDGNASIVNEFASTEDLKIDRHEHTKSRESLNNAHQTFYGTWTRTSLPGKNAKNPSNVNSVKGKDIIYQRDSHNSQFASEGNKQIDGKKRELYVC